MTVEKQLLYLLSKKVEMDGKELIRIFEEMNYTPQSIRNNLSKFKRMSYITSLERGIYKITPSGLNAYRLYAKKDNYYTEHWNGKWYVVFLEIPETLRKKRDAFRKGLLDLGFGMLYKSVYVYPWDVTDKVLHLIDSLEIEDYVTIISSNEFLLNGIDPEGRAGPNNARSLWNLEEINTTYKNIKIWIEKEYTPEFNRLVENKNRDTLHVFTNFLTLKEIRDDLLLADPMLPAEFLPGSWLGTTVLFSLDKFIQTLADLIPKDSYYSSFVADLRNK
ncbi:PaaX family transcriptional regulator C-terminal domain-containing protein [Aureibacillus halotolerans]|uniref:PaaX family transcriptional regulator n=1 Tax=Aureibacillus halotolerans TaxID=1508390 RepID=A0A4R6U352_9BACI|nr:PaaX family transcriptional regulator C-terminal domain-containing protein [Aureibacillus halotolerans]TDQ40878.1 PaaX family transcriptional regulator [Aureibacillus halotolerans]